MTTNAATLVKVPKPARKAIAPLDRPVAAFLKAAEAHPFGVLLSVALSCGLRLGGATGPKWEDVNLESGEVQIRQ